MSVSVCPRAYLQNHTSDPDLPPHFCALRMAMTHSSCGSVLHISGFMDDIIYAHKLRLLDLAARLRLTRSLGLWPVMFIAGRRHSGLLLAVMAY